jgi:hypothetical protein
LPQNAPPLIRDQLSMPCSTIGCWVDDIHDQQVIILVIFP